MTSKTFKTALFALLVLSIGLPGAMMASADNDKADEKFERDYIKAQMKEKKAELKEERKISKASEKANIDKKIKNADLFLEIIANVEKLEQNPDDKVAEKRLKEIQKQVDELAAERGTVTELRDTGAESEIIETDSFMQLVQYAHAAYNYFSFNKTVQACGTPEYSHILGGYIRPENTLEVYLGWNFPSVMRLDGDCNTQLDYEGSHFYYSGLESDLSGWYYCHAIIAETYPYGSTLYNCNYASAGDSAYLSAYSHYEDNNDYLVGNTFKILS